MPCCQSILLLNLSSAFAGFIDHRSGTMQLYGIALSSQECSGTLLCTKRPHSYCLMFCIWLKRTAHTPGGGGDSIESYT